MFMNFVFACGGTGGHINPALAIAGELHRRHPGAVIRFIGNSSGMESRLVPEAGYEFVPIQVEGLRRSLSPRSVAHNLSAVRKAAAASRRCRELLQQWKPDAVVGTGGYVSGPVLRAAHQCGFKTAAHEQNAYPGIATKMLASYVDVVLLAMPKAQEYLPRGGHYVVTGNPVRAAIAQADRQAARRAFGMDGRPMILSFGGSLGARRINETVADLIGDHCAGASVYHYHAMGRDGARWMPALLEEKGIRLADYPQLRVSEYIHDMDACLAAADLVICRAGATTLSELEVMGRASILIPSPNVTENHQFHNAMTLAERGAAVVIEEKELTSQRLIDEVHRLLKKPDTLQRMAQAARQGALCNASALICNQIETLMGR